MSKAKAGIVVGAALVLLILAIWYATSGDEASYWTTPSDTTSTEPARGGVQTDMTTGDPLDANPAPLPTGWVPLDVEFSVPGNHATAWGRLERPASEKEAARTFLVDQPGMSFAPPVREGREPQLAGQAPPTPDVFRATFRQDHWTTIGVGAGLPPRESMESLELLMVRAMSWLSSNDPTQLHEHARPVLPINRRDVPDVFKPKAVFWAQSSGGGINAEPKMRIRGIEPSELDDPKETIWLAYAERLGYNPWPPKDCAIPWPMFAYFTVPVIDGNDAASEMKVMALYCFDTHAWLLVHAEIEPDGRPLTSSPRWQVQFGVDPADRAIIGHEGQVKAVSR